MKRHILFIILLASILTCMAGDLSLISNTDEYMIYNKNNSKIIRYCEVKAGQSVTFRTVQLQEVKIYTRLVMSGKTPQQYSYDVAYNGTRKSVSKQARYSKTSHGVNGQNVSKYNMLRLAIPADNHQITVINTSTSTMLLKVTSNGASRDSRSIDYIAYSPDAYDTEKVLKLNTKEYTYYNGANISLTLEGPIYLKVVSRLLFENTFTPSMHYAYSIYDNETLLNTYTEKAHKSENTCLVGDATVIPSTGDVNIIRLDAGTHRLRIEDGAINRNVIFKFYISKSAVEIESK